MFGKKETFRRAALERLASPERLDEMMRSLPPKGWFAMLTVGLLATLAVLWGFFGSIPSRVEGPGLLIPGRTRSVDAPNPGVVTRIFVKAGDIVNPGDRVAILTDPDAAGALQSLQRELEGLAADDRKAQVDQEVARAQGESAYNQIKLSNEAKLRQQEAIADPRRGGSPANRLATMEDSPGIYGEAVKAPVRAQVRDAQNQINVLRAELLANEKKWRDDENARADATRERRQKIERKQREIEVKRLDQGMILEARHRGRVFDVLVDEGSTVTPQMLVRIEEFDQPLQAIVYVPAREGQSVKSGDAVQIAPSNVKKEEYGTILASVIAKNEYPMNKAGIINDIRNETLAEEYTKSGAPLRIVIDLESNEEALSTNPELSGYKWTSGDGPTRKILSGTPCNATVITGYGRPIDRAITWLKTATGL